jgi:hypothetical protein
MSVKCTGKHLLIEVTFEGIVYDCLVSSDLKNLFRCDPIPENWVEIENLIRDAAWNGNIENLEELG